MTRVGDQRPLIGLALVVAIIVAAAPSVDAYIGPGAGFVLVQSFFVLLTTVVLVVVSLLAWPFRAFWRRLTAKVTAAPRVGRLVIVGFDGQDAALTERLMREGRLPNFSRLAESGSYRRLRTTFPAVSPVAWSSFSTGCDPGRHNIFDFLAPDRRTYLPVLSSTRIRSASRFLTLGRFRWPLDRPELQQLRKSRPFWSILGEHRVWSSILRVPITFPPDRFYGCQLSAMCVPDLLGTQGTFMLFTTRRGGQAFAEGGTRVQLAAGQDAFDAVIEGPENQWRTDGRRLTVPLRISLDRGRRTVRVDVGGTAVTLEPGSTSPWVRLTFQAAPGLRVRGLTRLLVTEMDSHFSLYVAPINLDPDAPAMPISHPPFYASYLAKRIGPYATLGLAEDTWAVNEGVLDEAAFFSHACDVDREREQMLFAALDKVKRGNVVCVFDGTDRVQHMFWRQMRVEPDSVAQGVIPDWYARNDALLGRLTQRLQPGDVVMVLSDHGFTSFRRGVNLNAWLLHEGYLAVKPGARGNAEWLRDVDWARTRAYALGLTGLYLNLAGRERHGIVQPGTEADALKAELVGRLSGLRDHEVDEVAIREAFDTAKRYSGPYVDNSPDLLIGYNAGYRVSWDSARGIVAGAVFEDNTRAWSGDHCVDPRLVPGVFFCNRHTTTEDPALVDIAPTVLRLFGITPPPYMDGRPLEGLA